MVSPPPPPPRGRSRLPPADPRLVQAVRDPSIRTLASGLVQHALEALGDLSRLDESLYERFMEGGGRVADDAAPEALLRRLGTMTFRGARGLIAFVTRLRPKETAEEDPSSNEFDFDFGEGGGSPSGMMAAAAPDLDFGLDDIENALDNIDEHTKVDEETRWKELLEKISSIEYGLRSQVGELDARLDNAFAQRQVAQALESLDDTRTSVSEGIFALLAHVYEAFLPEVDPTTVAPGHLTSLQRALLVRRGLTDLTRAVQPLNEQLQSDKSSTRRKEAALAGIREAVSAFVNGDVFKSMRPADRWELTKFNREQSTFTGAALNFSAEGLAKYLESLGSVSRREVLITHDQRALEELRETLAAARPLSEINMRVAAGMVKKALVLADALYGRAAHNDELIIAIREATPPLTNATEVTAMLDMLDMLLSGEQS